MIITNGLVNPRPVTNTSINFENISFEKEVEILKGSVFDESIDRQTSDAQHLSGPGGNIESMYMTAQIILDDLSSRTLTRQSLPKANTATSTSRIHLYNPHLAEEHKLRLALNTAPEKPEDQKTCSEHSSSMTMTHDEIMIVNQDEKRLNQRSESPQETKSAQRHSSINPAQTLVQFKPFIVPTNDHSLNQSLSSHESPVEIQFQATVNQQEELHTQLTQQSSSNGDSRSSQKQQRSNPVSNECGFLSHFYSNIQDGKMRNGQECYGTSLNFDSGKKPTEESNAARSTTLKYATKGKKIRAHDHPVYTPGDSSVPVLGLFAETASSNQPDSNSNRGKKLNAQLPARMMKASSVQTNMNLQHGLLSTRALQVGHSASKVAKFLAKKKASLPAGALGSFGDKQKLCLKEELADLSHRLAIHHQTSRRVQEAETDKVKVSKKLIASLKNNIQSPLKATNLTRLSEPETHLALRQSPQVAASRQLAVKGLTPAKTMSHFGDKTQLFVQQQLVQLQQTTLQRQVANSGPKVLKVTLSGSKRSEEKTKPTSSRKNAMSGSAPNVFYPDKASRQLQASNEQQLSSLKEQVLLEALRREGKQAAPSDPILQQQQQQQHLTTLAPGIQSPASMKRSQTMVTGSGFLSQAKSMVSQKVDLYSIAGKLKMLNHPNKNPNSASANIAAHTASRQRLSGSTNSKNSLKFNSRKVSVEQRVEVLHSQTNNGSSSQTAKQQQTHRFTSADGQQMLSSTERKSKEQKQSHKAMVENGGAKTGTQRKLIKAPQQADAFYSQRSQRPIPLPTSPTDQAINSRNHMLCESSCTQELKQMQTVQSNKVCFQEVQRQESRQREQKLRKQGKKKKQKLSRAITGPVGNTQSFGEGAIRTQVLSPRQLAKDFTTGELSKTRNTNLGASQTTQLRIVKLHQGSVSTKQLSQQTQTTPKQTIVRQHPQLLSSAGSNFESAAHAQMIQQHHHHHHSSRNAGLPAAASQKIITGRNDFNLTSSSKLGLSNTAAQALQSNQQLPPAISAFQSSQIALKQELKLHSRKSSAVFSKQSAYNKQLIAHGRS